MAHSISISDETFARMQSLAIPLVDTPDSIIARALAALEKRGAPTRPGSRPSVHSFNPAAPPSLSHTTPTSITLCDTKFDKSETSWNNLMIAVVREAAKRGKSPKEIHKMMTVNSGLGLKVGAGYKHIKEAGISVQGQDANAAWRQAYTIASQLGLGIEVEFVWQDSPKAALPKTIGRFSVGSAVA